MDLCDALDLLFFMPRLPDGGGIKPRASRLALVGSSGNMPYPVPCACAVQQGPAPWRGPVGSLTVTLQLQTDKKASETGVKAQNVQKPSKSHPKWMKNIQNSKVSQKWMNLDDSSTQEKLHVKVCEKAPYIAHDRRHPLKTPGKSSESAERCKVIQQSSKNG